MEKIKGKIVDQLTKCWKRREYEFGNWEFVVLFGFVWSQVDGWIWYYDSDSIVNKRSKREGAYCGK